MPAGQTPAGECPQCWQHAHDKSIHRALGPGQDCPGCIAHLRTGCPYLVPKTSRWW